MHEGLSRIPPVRPRARPSAILATKADTYGTACWRIYPCRIFSAHVRTKGTLQLSPTSLDSSSVRRTASHREMVSGLPFSHTCVYACMCVCMRILPKICPPSAREITTSTFAWHKEALQKHILRTLHMVDTYMCAQVHVFDLCLS